MLSTEPSKNTRLNKPTGSRLVQLESHREMTGVNELSSQETEHFSQYLKNQETQNFAVQSFGRRVFVANFVNKRARGPFQIEVPEQGDFTLEIQLGNGFDILDNDATDGLATLVLPQAVYDTVFHLQRNRKAHTELQVHDALYQVEDSLTSDKYKWIDLKRFLRLGFRPVPVPESWHSDEGSAFTLHFQAKNLEGFQMLWVQSDEPAPMPPGIAEIDAQGGEVVLPGIGRLVVPEGAFLQKTIIRLKPLNEVIEPFELSSESVEARRFVSSVVQVYTEDPVFLKPAWLELDLNVEALGENDPFVVSWSHLQVVENVAQWYSYRFAQESSQGQVQVKINAPGVYARTTPSFITPYTSYRPLESSGFRVQQLSSCGAFTPIFVLDQNTSAGIESELSSASCFLAKVYHYYAGLITQAGGILPDIFGLVYIGGDTERDPRTYPSLYNPAQSEPFISLPVPSNIDDFEETLAHELWHVFQYKNSFNSLTGPIYYALERWLQEGPAVHIAAKATLEYGKGNISNYNGMIYENQNLMFTTVNQREAYRTTGFFSYYAQAKAGELALARLAVEFPNKAEMYSLNRDFGYEALKKAPFFFKNVEVGIEEKLTLTDEYSRETPLKHYDYVSHFATRYIKVDLDENLNSDGDYTLYAKSVALDGSSLATLTLSSKGKPPSDIKSTHTLGENYAKIENVKPGDYAVITISNGNTGYNPITNTDNFEVHLALEQEDKSRVEVSTSSRYSQGSVDPVTVNLTIRDIAGEPANGRYFVGVDAGSFTVTSPTPAGPFDNAGAFVDVIEGRVTLEYRAKGVTKSFGELVCGGSEPCKANSVRFKVSGCDYKYYGKARCPILGPGKDLQQDGVESDEGRIYTTWFDGQVSTQKREYLPNGNKTRISLNGLKDNAGRALKTGFWLFLDNPYYGNLYRTDGSSSGVWTQIAVQNGSLSFQYEAADIDVPCWPFLDLKDFVTIDDSRYRESWRRIALEVTYKEVVDCEK